MIVALYAAGVPEPGNLPLGAAKRLLVASSRQRERERVRARHDRVLDTRAAQYEKNDLANYLRGLMNSFTAFLSGGQGG